MLSIIVCSANEQRFSQFESNLLKTIKFAPYEVIRIANGDAAMGICEAYNKGASQAKYPYLCFVHEDVSFITEGWGKRIIDYFENNPDVALAGLAGSKYKSRFITGWTTGQEAFDRMNVYHQFQDGAMIHLLTNPDQEVASQVVVLDGVFLFTRREEWEQNKFDETNKGFHFYDIAFSLQMSSKNKKCVVVFFIDLIHFSTGGFNGSWLRSAYKFHHKKITQQRIDMVSLEHSTSMLDTDIKLYWKNRLRQENIPRLKKLKLYLLHYGLIKETLKSVLSFAQRKIAN